MVRESCLVLQVGKGSTYTCRSKSLNSYTIAHVSDGVILYIDEQSGQEAVDGVVLEAQGREDKDTTRAPGANYRKAIWEID